MKHLFRTPARVLLLPLILLVVAAVPAQAQEPVEQQREHVVRRGDTLWDLASAYLQNPFLWRLIYEANRDVVENPHWIYPAERLVIPPVLAAAAAEPELDVAVREPRDLPPPLGVPATDPIGAPMPGEPTGDLLPLGEAVEVTTLDLRDPVVGESEYLAAPWVSETTRSQVVGKVVSLADPTSMRDRMSVSMYPQDRVNVDLGPNPARAGLRLQVVRFGREVGDRGVIVQPVAVLEIESITGSVATARVRGQSGTARTGDAVIWLEPVPLIRSGEPVRVHDGVAGELMEFLTREPLYGPPDLGFISVGTSSGVGIGDEFMVYVPSRTVDHSAELPAEVVATVRVVKTGDRVSTVRVLSVNSSALRGGLAVRAIRRMP